MFNQQELVLKVMGLIPSILSLTVHEWSHAWSAKMLGDDTAERQGRLTLNPLVHIDPIGTILLPLLGVPFGWAKPVPVNPLRFKRSVSMRTGMAITAFAGPASNFVLAVLCAVSLGLWWRFSSVENLVASPVPRFLTNAVVLNLSLGLFNLLPVPPLDGSRIAYRFMSHRFPKAWAFLEDNASLLLVGLFFGARYILATPLQVLLGALEHLIATIAQR